MTWKKNEISIKTKENEDNVNANGNMNTCEKRLRKTTKSTMKTADRETHEKATGKKCLCLNLGTNVLKCAKDYFV